MPQALDELFSDKQLKRDSESLQRWGCDRTSSFDIAPSAIVFPESVAEVQALVQREHPELFPSVQATSSFVTQVLSWDTSE